MGFLHMQHSKATFFELRAGDRYFHKFILSDPMVWMKARARTKRKENFVFGVPSTHTATASFEPAEHQSSAISLLILEASEQLYFSLRAGAAVS